jgi:uncharacterized protein (DUF302 family)
MFHYTADSTKSLEETILSLEERLKEEQFGVLWDLNINEKLEAKGLKLDSTYRILEVCNPKEAHRVLSHNPLISYFLPCKIVVYEDGTGHVKVGMPKPTALISMVEDSGLKEIAQDIENRLMSCIQSSL